MALEIGAAEEVGEEGVGVEDCADDFDGGVGIADVLDGFVEPVAEFFALVGGIEGVFVLDIIEDDEGGAPLAVADTANFGSGGEGVDLDAVDVNSLGSPAVAARELGGVNGVEQPVPLEFAFDVAQALARLLLGCWDKHDVAFLPVEEAVDGQDQGFEC